MIINKNNKGFSYIEVLISLGLISIAIVPLAMAFFHISRTQTLSYYTYQKIILLDSIMTETVSHISNNLIFNFSQDDMNSIIVNSPINFRQEVFTYNLINFHVSDDILVDDVYIISMYFFIKIGIESDFGEAIIFRYSLFNFR